MELILNGKPCSFGLKARTLEIKYLVPILALMLLLCDFDQAIKKKKTTLCLSFSIYIMTMGVLDS